MSLTLLRARIEHVRGVDICEVLFAEQGVTVVHAPNEHGKSTLIEAIDLLLSAKSSSNAQRVKDIKPVGRDVGSEVEVELRCGDTHLTCRKRFNRQQLTELTVHSPVQEQLSGEDAHNRLREIIGQEVDEALFDALWFQQGRPLECVDLGDSSSIARALDAQAGGSGAGADDALLERVRQEFLRYYTPTGQPAKVLANAANELQRATTEEADIRQQLAGLQADIDELSQLGEREAQLQVRVAQLTPELDQLKQQTDRVAQLRQALETLEARCDAAAFAADTAASVQLARQELADSVQHQTDEVSSISKLLAPASERLSELEDRAELLQRELAEKESAVVTARAARVLAERVADLLRQRADRDHLRTIHDKVRTAAEQAATAEAAIESCRVTDELLQQIRTARHDVQLAESTLSAGAPTIVVHAVADIDFVADEQPSTLSAGEQSSHLVEDTIRLEFPDTATVSVHPGSSISELRAAAEQARGRYSEFCRSAGVTDVDAAEQAASERRDNQQRLTQAQGRMTELLGDLSREELTHRVESVAASVADAEAGFDDLGSIAQVDTEAAQTAVAEARDLEDDQSRLVEAARVASEELKQQIDTLRNEVIERQATLSARQDDLRIKSDELDRARVKQPDDALVDDSARTADESRKLAGELQGMQDELAELQPETVALLRENTERQLDDARAAIVELGHREIALRTRLEVVGEDGLGEALDAATASREHAEQERRRLHARAAAAKMLFDEMETARDEAYRTYREPLRECIVELGRLVFDPDFDVVLDEQLNITDRVLDGTTLPWSSLSSGAREQLAVISALAAAQLAAAGGTPLILDDTLGYSDPARMERLGAVLGAVGDTQTIVLTCVPDRFARVGGATVVSLRDAKAAARPDGRSGGPRDGSNHAGARSPDRPVSDQLETLSCQTCGTEWTRPTARGRKPRFCPDCS